MTIMVEGDVGAKCCGELRDIYCSLGSLKTIIDTMHDEFLNTGTGPSFERVEDAYLMVRDIYDEVERYILPIVGTDSVFREQGDEEPVCRV